VQKPPQLWRAKREKKPKQQQLFQKSKAQPRVRKLLLLLHHWQQVKPGARRKLPLLQPRQLSG
jgi:hypothetical protein